MRLRIFILMALALVPATLFAANPYLHKQYGIGQVATNLMDPVTMLANFISAGSMVIGISFLFGGFLKYMQHRVNPMASPISTVVLLVVMGAVLVCIPLLYKLTSSGIQTHI